MRACTLLLSALLASIGAKAAGQTSSNFSAQLAERPDVKRALATLDQGFRSQVDEWIRIAEMQAQSQHERERGEYVRRAFQRLGLEVSVDSIGNVSGRRRGTGRGPTIVLAAHMDIVHPMGTDLRVKRMGDTLRAPGIFDNSASVANMLAVARALHSEKVALAGDVIFLGTVQEELGLRGMEYWLDHNPKPDMVIGLDGGLGPINYGALGIYWTKYTFSAVGQHTVTSRGRPTPVRALAEAIDRIYELNPPPLPNGAVYNVGQVHGGAIYNGIPEELYFTMDLRSPNPNLLEELNAKIESAVSHAASAQGVQWKKEVVQRLRAGGTEEMLQDRRRHPLIQTAIDAHRFVGIQLPAGAEAVASGSTDANSGVVRGIPSISIGRSFGGLQHTLTEWAHWPSALPATKMLLLLTVAMSGNS